MYNGISVIVPCLNAQAFVAEAIESILRQKVECSLEILIGDDGCTDDTAKIAMQFGPKSRLVQHPGHSNLGVSAIRNLCVREAAYPLVGFLDLDGIWLLGHLERLVSCIDSDKSFAIAVDNGLQILKNGQLAGERTIGILPGTISPEALLFNQWFPPAGVVARKSALQTAGLFDITMKYGEDQDLWLRVLERRPGLCVEGIGYYFRIHGG